MQVQSLGHVVLKVRDQARSEAFYNGVLGIPIVARLESYKMTFFSLGNHHDLAIMAVGDDAETPPDSSVGLLHVAFNIGDSLDDLRAAKLDLEAAGIPVRPTDHGVAQSLYMKDPDGNEVEVYVDTSDAWKQDPQLIAQAEPLELA
ncbi:MAG: VOC family protein [Alphaproteobacteria bacterium]|jgi:catechol 2,3-dioxygenase